MDKPPDGSNPPDGDLFRTAQYLVQLLAGIDMRPEEYAEKVDLIKVELEKVYWKGYQKAAEKDVFRRVTVRPPTPPGGYPLGIDWSEDED